MSQMAGMKDKTTALAMSAILAGALLAASPAASQEISRVDALQGAIAGTPEGMQTVKAYLESGRASPGGISERALDLIGALSETDAAQDATLLADTAAAISDAADTAMSSLKIIKVSVLDDFKLDRGALGFDFGPPDGETMDGFTRVTAGDPRLANQPVRAMRRPNGDALLTDGIEGLRRFAVDVPNGRWRVVLLTDNTGVEDQIEQPFGQKLEINGVALPVANQAPENWVDEAFLGRSGTSIRNAGSNAASESLTQPTALEGGRLEQARSKATGTGSGGMIVTDIDVRDGAISLNIAEITQGNTFITGLILEPAEAGGTLALSPDAYELASRNQEGVLNAQEEIASAVGELVAEVAAAAGPGERAELLELDEPVARPNDVVSPN